MNAIKNLLPEKIKKFIRPLYKTARLVFKEKQSEPYVQFVSGFKVAYRKGTADENVIKENFDNDVFFPGVPEYEPKEDHVIVDVGAHLGAFSLLASSKVPKGKVYAVEACWDTFNLLSRNVLLNNIRNISVHHLALADKQGTIKLFYDTGNWGHSTVSRLSSMGETVLAETLSNFLKDNHIEKCHFIKFNCEGAEFPILLSTPAEVLQKFEAMLILYHGDLWRNNPWQTLVKHLQASGFNVVIRNRAEAVDRGWIIATNYK